MFLTPVAILAVRAMMTPETEVKIGQWLAQAANGDGLVKNLNLVYEELTKCQLLTRGVRLNPRSIGCHPCNRDGLGLNVDHTWQLLRDISDLGWKHGESRGIVVELQNDADGIAARTFNDGLVDKSMGKLLG